MSRDPRNSGVNRPYNKKLPISQTSNGLELDPEMEPAETPEAETEPDELEDTNES